ncbi:MULTISPECIES: MurR/RpiR family transcriptional regulator [Erwinia]|uniref:Transcriptional regulator n=1 Tax=Erwinia rhapontici TaxID=55212 RepID=A0ABM7MWS0_ERWRD|nr:MULTISPECIES: MurR/RpiR family transcriptional regulator [Erwinia]MBP2154350.1 DNA-binding MurR/RpiR family transcriptional regulator [Erwinia rhapontici]MCS3607007.1 DNA-binding MurR/RpiR family transcriptional regulator [Erwinia rhapontici]NKG30652.1 MurR/RpiR family transcriptional regulator [Erwinia rhapontici]NNS06623.1 MurR/RpiR family transcriptional regulator [Erwinia sp. JH02]TDS96173.1 RpiR family transcriptional regulator [Erwinia rhapontici]
MFTNKTISTLNALENKVYNFVIKNLNTVVYMTIRELANSSQVSTATVLRFCKKINFNGYSEFKAYLRMYLEQDKKILLPHGADEILSFFKSINNNDFDELIISAAEHIVAAERVIFVGAGSSGTLGKYGARFFSNIGKFSNHIDDPYYPVSTDMYKNAVAIVLSVSGETPEIIKLAKQFLIHQCKIVSITSNNKSTLALMADFNVSYHVSRVLIANEYDITTQVPVIYILESIGRQLANKMTPEMSQGVSFL